MEVLHPHRPTAVLFVRGHPQQLAALTPNKHKKWPARPKSRCSKINDALDSICAGAHARGRLGGPDRSRFHGQAQVGGEEGGEGYHRCVPSPFCALLCLSSLAHAQYRFVRPLHVRQSSFVDVTTARGVLISSARRSVCGGQAFLHELPQGPKRRQRGLQPC